MEKRGWYLRIYTKEYGPFTTECEAIELGNAHQALKVSFSTYYGHFFNFRKHKR